MVPCMFSIRLSLTLKHKTPTCPDPSDGARRGLRFEIGPEGPDNFADNGL